MLKSGSHPEMMRFHNTAVMAGRVPGNHVFLSE
jgi:hypothetical protein